MDLDTEQKELTSSSSKCANCGSELFFDPKSKGLKCNSCGSIFNFPITVSNEKHDLNLSKQSFDTDNWAEENKMVKCQTCGATVVVNGLALTQECPYCGSKYVIEINNIPGLKPDCVIPFKFDKEEACRIFKEGIKKKFFVPSKLKKTFKAESIKGIYIPSFSFDGDTSSSYNGVLTRTKTVTDSKGRTRTEVKSFNISGTYDYDYKNILVESCTQIDTNQFNSVLPYNLAESCLFDNNFLRGYYVEHYNDSLDKCYDQANDIVKSSIRSGILSQYTYDGVQYLNIDTDYDNEKYNYQLLPLYYVNFVYRNKNYCTIMNGQTGKIGKGLPISPIKVSIVAGIILIFIIVVIILFINYYNS